ncbi:MAG: protein kinase domain-containing protein [Bdellovibrionia bacterium]
MAHSKFVALLLIAGSAIAAENSSHGPEARLYDGNQIVAEILSYDSHLGDGLYGNVEEITLRDSKGQITKAAMKLFNMEETKERRQSAIHNLSLLKPVFEQDHHGVLSHSSSGLKLVPTGARRSKRSVDVIISPLVNGSVYSKSEMLALKPKTPDFEARLDVLLKYKRQVLEGMSLLASNGLTHGDVKPVNVLYALQAGFDWKNPDPSKIRFMLSDYDTVTPIGKSFSDFGWKYAPPELLLNHTDLASPASDLFSHALSVYQLALGKPSWEHQADREKLYANPKLYEEHLKALDHSFALLEEQAPSESSRRKIKELRDFVSNGLKHSPTERLKAFPAIWASHLKYAHASAPCENLAERVEALLRH